MDNKIKNLVLRNGAIIATCVLVAAFGMWNWVLSNPGSSSSSIGEDITVGNNLYVTGNASIGTTSSNAPLTVSPNNDHLVVSILGGDQQYFYNIGGLYNHTVTFDCGSYFSAEIIITANQTNGGADNNLYIRGIWTNNHTSHHWKELDNVGSLSGSSFTITNSAAGTDASGRLVIQHDYTGGSFSSLKIRVISHYSGFSYSLN